MIGFWVAVAMGTLVFGAVYRWHKTQDKSQQQRCMKGDHGHMVEKAVGGAPIITTEQSRWRRWWRWGSWKYEPLAVMGWALANHNRATYRGCEFCGSPPGTPDDEDLVRAGRWPKDFEEQRTRQLELALPRVFADEVVADVVRLRRHA